MIRPLYERQTLELVIFEVGNLGQNTTFSAVKSIFNDLNESLDRKVLHGEKSKMTKIEKLGYFLI